MKSASNKNKPLRIILTGGGTAGPVVPVLAVAKELHEKRPDAQFLFIGTNKGPEKELAEKAGIRFVSIVAGKLRRYWSLLNIFTPFQIVIGFFQAREILKRLMPDVVIGAGGFVQVPVMWSAWFLGIPVVIHQQDIASTLSNKLVSPIASVITTTFEASLTEFSSGSGLPLVKHTDKIHWTGNPSSLGLPLPKKAEALERFGLAADLPVLAVFGGGTGAAFFNSFIAENLGELLKYFQIIHITGKGKGGRVKAPGYTSLEFCHEMDLVYAAADVVLTRAGLSTITELALLQKLAVVIPMPNSHQEDNAALLWKTKAAVVLDQESLTVDDLIKRIRKVLIDSDEQKRMRESLKKLMPQGAASKIADLVIGVAENKK